MGIIIGLGCGRVGTQSLAKLLNSQPHTVCFHELNPSAMSWSDSINDVTALMYDFSDILSGRHRCLISDKTGMRGNNKHSLNRLRDTSTITNIGDIGFYYLPYVEQISSNFEAVKFPCLIRNKNDVIHSFKKRLKANLSFKKRILYKMFLTENYREYRNHWTVEHGTRWIVDRKWDKCFPKVKCTSSNIDDYISEYYNNYYKCATFLSHKYPEKLKLFDINKMNTIEGRKEIYNFCNIKEMNLNYNSHLNK